MRSWQLAATGEPSEQLRIVDAPSPDVGAGQLLISTRAVGLSFPDVLMCRGEYQIPTPVDFVPGGETAGEVIAVGNGKVLDSGELRALDLKAGDKVLFGKYSGTEVKVEGEELLVMKEDEVMAVIEG